MQPINIVGAGLAGSLLAVLFARRGLAVNLYERRADPRAGGGDDGRSINLALAARGLRALQYAGLLEQVQPLGIPMRGRMVHALDGRCTLQPYGQAEHEVIHSIERAALNRVLAEQAAGHAKVRTHYRHACAGVDPARNELFMRATGAELQALPLTPTIAADGAGSAVRDSLTASGHIRSCEKTIEHEYKELGLPPRHGGHALDPHALHIWPRGGFMLIALPNTDGSFTATLFLPRSGPVSFAAIVDAAGARALFEREFADVLPLMPHLEAEFAAHPRGQLGSIITEPWHVGGELLLIGDAAHAVVPFHGQGMNAAFEDCRLLDELAGQSLDLGDFGPVFAEFERTRRADVAALAQMSLENHAEMRDSVREAPFVARKILALELERRFPRRFIPRYSMVMFHSEIGYAEALRRGVIQEEILSQLEQARGPGNASVDVALARQLIESRLAPLAA